MSPASIAVRKTGLVTSVGLSAPAACAAMRARLTNPTETRFVNSTGEFITAHQVPLDQPWIGRVKLVKMAAAAIEECLADVPREDWSRLPMILCVAERERPGRMPGLDDALLAEVQEELQVEFAAQSVIVAHGRVSVVIALRHARKLIEDSAVPQVLIAGTDSLLTGPTLRAYDNDGRLLSPVNSNGFLPGEGAGALLMGPEGSRPELICAGLGFGTEAAHIDSEEPLRAEGLTDAIKSALVEAQCEIHDMDFRITDLSGEQYYFKEATLALARLLRKTKEEFDIWHPAECIGETGALAGIAVLCVADAACRKGYVAGPNILAHMANDAGQRAGIVCHFGRP